MIDAVGYVQVGAQRVWHEVSGTGAPLVLLHGAFSGAHAFGAQTPHFVSAGFRVHVPERRAHAHTPDVDGPLTYAVMADDTIAYLDQQVGTAAHLVGWSDGAVVALLVARRRPDLVDRLVLIGQYYNSTGKAHPDVSLDERAKSFLRRAYDPYSPDGPDHFDVVFAKTMHMLDTEPELELADFVALAAPTLILQGDRDDVTVEHSLAVVAALPDARLAVLPGTHGLPLELPDVVNPLIVRFLRDEVRPAW